MSARLRPWRPAWRQFMHHRTPLGILRHIFQRPIFHEAHYHYDQSVYDRYLSVGPIVMVVANEVTQPRAAKVDR